MIIFDGAAFPFSFSRQNGQPLDVTSVMRTLADITTYAANAEKKYVPYEGQTIACLEDKMLYILELKNGVLVPKQSGGVKLIKRDDNVELTDDAALSALRSVKEIEERAISRLKRDTAAEVIEFVKGLTAAGGKTTVSGDGKITTLNLLVQVLADTYDLNVSHVATMMRTIIKDYVSSEAFTPGLTGEGFKISKAINGDWNLEVDNIVVRKVMTIFEMIISKVRSVNGGLVISPANGRIKSVAETTGSPAYYVIDIEGDMQFVVDDLVRCQVFSNGHAKHYWVRVSSISGNSILVLKSEFTNGAVPAIGDDLVQMGNATNKARQGVIYLTASEDGKPRISVMDGVNSTSLVGKNKVILGCLDGITDTDFPADFQPSGYGLYAMNVFLKGIFVLRSGKSVESEITAAQNAAATAQAKADTVTRLFQEFTVAGGLFESKITEVKEYADGKVNALQVGGTNLLKNSSNWRPAGWNGGVSDNGGGYTIDNTVLYHGNPTLKTDVGAGLYHPWLTLEPGVEYTYSAMALCESYIPNNSSVPLHYHAGKDNANQGKINVTKSDTGLNPGVWKLIHIVFKLTDDADSFRPFLYRGENSGTFFWVAYMKLERGNKPTDWTPAPEDVTADAQAKADEAKQAAIDDAANKYPTKTEVSTSITQLSNSITFKADKSEVTAIDTRLKSAEMQITPDAIRSTVKSQTESIAKDAVDGVQIGTRNLFLNGDKEIGKNEYFFGTINYSAYPRFQGKRYTLTACYTLGAENTYIAPYNGNYTVAMVQFRTHGDRVIESKTFIAQASFETDVHANFHQFPDGKFGSKVHWAVLTEGNKGVTSFIEAPEDIAAAIDKAQSAADEAQGDADALGGRVTKTESDILQNANDIKLRVTKETFDKLGNRVTAAESTLTVQATQIASKVSQSDFNTLGQRVSTAETSITQQAGQIDLKASKSDLGALTGRVTSAEAELRVHATEIGLKVTAGDVSAGMTITANKITLFGKEFDLTGKITFSSMAPDAQGKITTAQGTADRAITDAANSLVTSRNNIASQLGYGSYDAMSAAAIAGKTIINGGKIRTELIDATAIVTGALVSEVISATNITTGKLTVTDGAVIGGFTVKNEFNSYSLINNDLSAKIVMQSTSNKYIRIGGGDNTLISMRIDGSGDGLGNNGIFIQSYGNGNRCLDIIANVGSEYAISSYGPHLFGQRAGEEWNAPGVLWAGRCNSGGTVLSSWGSGTGGSVSVTRNSTGYYHFSHNLGHTQYYVTAMANAFTSGSKNWALVARYADFGDNSFRVSFRNLSDNDQDPIEFMVVIYGRNRW